MEEIEYSCETCSGKAATVTHKFSKLPRYQHKLKYMLTARLEIKHN